MFRDLKIIKQLTVIILLIVFQIQIIKQVSATEPINYSYNLPGQTWSFIGIENLIINNIVDYEWIATISVQGKLVTKEQYDYLQSLNLAERAMYFESLDFTEGLFDNGRTKTNSEGKLFFVFYNPNVTSANLEIILIYRSNAFSPMIIGIVTSLVTIFILSLGIFWAIRTKRKMNQNAAEKEKTPIEKYLEI